MFVKKITSSGRMLVFSNGGAKKRSSRKVTKGRVHKPVDVRSRGDIGKFENLLSQGPFTLVLVYADWCGACHNFRNSTWKDIVKMPNKSVNVSAVREDMFPETSLKNTPITHYPSLLLVGNNKKPTEFKTPDGETTNVLPDNSKELLTKIVTTPTNEPNTINSAVNEIVNEKTNEKTNENVSMKNQNTIFNDTIENITLKNNKSQNNILNTVKNNTVVKNNNSNITPRNVETILQNDEEVASPNMEELYESVEPPTMNEDIEQSFVPSQNLNTVKPAAGGGLYQALQQYASKSTKAFRFRKCKTQKRHKRKRSTKKRR